MKAGSFLVRSANSSLLIAWSWCGSLMQVEIVTKLQVFARHPVSMPRTWILSISTAFTVPINSIGPRPK